MNLILLAAAQLNVPSTPEWSIAIGLVMIVCNILGLESARYSALKRGTTASSPVPGFGIPQFIAGTAFGHVLGTGAILGLTNLGAL